MLNKKIVGEIELIDLPDIDIKGITARIDSGAHVSSIWATKVVETNGSLSVIFFDESSPFYSGKIFVFDEFEITRIKSSNGFVQTRYKILLDVNINNHLVKEKFTLADRSKMKYPILIGRNILKDRFLIDVSLQNDQLIEK